MDATSISSYSIKYSDKKGPGPVLNSHEFSNIDAQTPQKCLFDAYLYKWMHIQYIREKAKVHGAVNKHIPLAKWGKVKTIPSTGMKGQRRISKASSITHKLIELTQAQQQNHVEIRVKTTHQPKI